MARKSKKAEGDAPAELTLHAAPEGYVKVVATRSAVLRGREGRVVRLGPFVAQNVPAEIYEAGAALLIPDTLVVVTEDNVSDLEEKFGIEIREGGDAKVQEPLSQEEKDATVTS